MATNPYDLTVHDIKLEDTTNFGRAGQVVQQKRLTFYVGEHGPFVKVYAPAEATTERLKSDIDTQVSQLRELSTFSTQG